MDRRRRQTISAIRDRRPDCHHPGRRAAVHVGLSDRDEHGQPNDARRNPSNARPDPREPPPGRETGPTETDVAGQFLWRRYSFAYAIVAADLV
jgi:hypothetical protein